MLALTSLIATSYVASDGETRTSLKLDLRYENAHEAISKIVALDADPQTIRSTIQATGIHSFGSLENLLTAYATLHDYLTDNYDDTAKLKKYWGHLANNVVFIQISTDVSNALKIFETINERGVGLNPMDLLKNLLFTNVKQDRFTRLKDDWKKITKPLEKTGQKPLRFLRYFLMANYEISNPRGDAVVREDEIYDWFTNKRNAALCDYAAKPFEFVQKIVRNVEHYLAFIDGNGNDGKASIAMDGLRSLCGGGFSLHHVLLLAASNFPKPLFDHFLRQLESFLFFYIFTKTSTKDLERNFSGWADELRTISAIVDPKTQGDMLNAFVSERFQKSMDGKEQELADALRRYTLYSMQQYRTCYLLAKLTQFVDMAYKGLKVPGSLADYTTLEIEHILPTNPQKELRQSFDAANPDVRYDDCKNWLGNLALLEKPINIVAGNDFFSSKKNEFRKSKYYLTSSLAELTTVGHDTSINRINEKLVSFDDWTAKRRELLISLAKDVWKTEAIA